MEDMKKNKLLEMETAMSSKNITLQGMKSRPNISETKISEAEVTAIENTKIKH